MMNDPAEAVSVKSLKVLGAVNCTVRLLAIHTRPANTAKVVPILDESKRPTRLLDCPLNVAPRPESAAISLYSVVEVSATVVTSSKLVGLPAGVRYSFRAVVPPGPTGML